MKKKYLISLLPVLMSLSACAGNGAKDETKEDEIFVTDTLAHDDEFARGETTYLSKARRNLDPVDPSIDMPVAVQKSGTYNVEINSVSTECVSVRFVAAVKAEDSSKKIEWVRKIYDDDGVNVSDATAPLESTHPYTAIHDGGTMLDIENFEEGAYHHFITYTVRKIPTIYLGYYMTVTLSVAEEEVKVIGTNVNIDKQVSFTPGVTRSFLKGKLGGTSGTTYNADNPTEGTNNASFNRHLLQNDAFYVVYNDTGKNEFAIIGSEALAGEGIDTLFVDDGLGHIKAIADGDYSIYLTTSNEVHANKQTYTDYFIRGTFNDFAAQLEYKFTTSDNNTAQIIDVYLEEGWEFFIASENWHKKWQIRYYTLDNGYTNPWPDSGGFGGGAAGNFVEAATEARIKVDSGKSGYYRFYINSSQTKIYVEARP